MTNVNTLAGNSPSSNLTIVNVNKQTLDGDGSISRPLNAISGSTPLTSIVFRPGSPAVNGKSNVYNTWASAYAAVQSVAQRGAVNLQFDARFSTTVEPTSLEKSCVIPAGVWNMENVTWTQFMFSPLFERVFVELADGCSIVMDTLQSTLKIAGGNLTVFSNRTGPICPLVDVNLILSGTRTELRNTLLVPGALPMIKIGLDGAVQIIIDGSNSGGGIGGGGFTGNPPSVSPVIDVAGQFLIIQGGAGHLKDNSITDSVGGGFSYLWAKDDNFNGSPNAAENFSFPELTPGAFWIDAQHRARRYVEDLGGAPVDPSFSPWAAFYNEMVPCDPTVGGGVAAVEVIAPSASIWGEQFTVKDFLGNASAGDTILISALPGESLDGAASQTINTPFGSRTYTSNGYGTWMLQATANL